MSKKILNFLFFIICSSVFLFQANAQKFTDVNSTHPYYNAIENLAEEGILNGYADGTFKPDNAINRVEILKVLLLGSNIEIEETSYNAGFPDVISSSWYAKYIVKAKEKGIIRGNPNGYFYPNNQVNFAEALKMLALTNQVQLNTNFTQDPFADVPQNSWYAPYFDYAKSINIIRKNSNEKAFPSQLLNRGETAQLIFLFREAQKTKGDKQIATYYADSLEGNTTASGEIFTQTKLTGAHKTLPFGTKVKVTNLENNESVIITINDRGPYASDASYVLDLSKSAFQAISPLSRGIIEIKYEVIESNENNSANTSSDGEEDKLAKNETEKTETISKTLESTESKNSEEDLSSCEKDYTKKEISVNFYENITLNQALPNIFQKDEIYLISGNVEDNETSFVTVFLINSDNREKEYRFEGKVENGNFTIPVHFQTIGNFNLGILKGTSGQSFIAEIKVISNQCLAELTKSSIAPTNLKIEYQDNKTVLSWDNHQQKLSKIEIKQGKNQKTYFINNGTELFQLPYQDFENFSKGEVFFTVSGAESASIFSVDQSSKWTSSKTKAFLAVKRHQVFNNTKQIDMNNLPEKYTFGEKILFTGKSTKDLKINASIILPNGLIEEIELSAENFETNDLNQDIIKANQSFTFDYAPSIQGTYIIEINKDNGFAVINMPIYENNSIPLLPDIWDLNPNFLDENREEIDLEKMRNDLIEKINQSRKEFGSNLVETDNKINQLAQFRAEDMANNNYLEHQNLQGLYANDLKINYGIKSSVSENIAKDSTLDFAHAGLMRSAIHRANILGKKWTRVGLGIALDSEGYLIIVEEFSEEELSENDLPDLRNQIIETINQNRSIELISKITLENIAQEWSENILNQNDVWFENPDTGISLSYLTSSQLPAGTQNASTILKGYFNPILEQLNTNETVLEEKWKNIGIGITQNDDGTLNITLVYSD